MIDHKKNTSYPLVFPMVDSAAPSNFKSGISPSVVAYSKDGAGSWTLLAIADSAAEIGSTGVYDIDISASEMNHDYVMLIFSGSGAANSVFIFSLTTNDIDDVHSNLTTVDTVVDGIKSVTDLLPDAGALTSIATSAALTTVDTNIDAIKATTDLLPDSGALTSLATASALATVSGNVDSILVDTAEIGPAGSGLTSLGGMSAAMKAEVNAEVDTAITDAALATAASLTTVDSVVDAIKAVTDLLPDAGALSSLATAANLAIVDTNVDSILVDTGTDIPASITALNDLSSSDVAGAVLNATLSSYLTSGSVGEAISDLINSFVSVKGAVSDVAPVTTDFDSNLTETTDDFFKDKEVVFTSGNNKGIGRICTGYVGSSKNLAFDEAFPEAIADTDTFVVLTNQVKSITTLAQTIRADLDSNSAQLAAIVADTAEIGIAGAGLTDLGGMSTNMKAEVNTEADTAIIAANVATASALTTVNNTCNSIKATTDSLPNGGTLSSLATASALATVDSNVDSILVDTSASIPSQISSINPPTSAQIVDAILDGALSGHTTAGTLGKALSDLLTVTISTKGSISDATPSNTTFDTDLTETTDDALRGLQVLFITGNNVGISRICTSYTGSTKTLTFDKAFPKAVADTDSFIVLTKNYNSLIQLSESVRAEIDSNSTKLADIETDTQDLQTQIGTAGAGLTDLGGMSTGMKAEVNTEADTAISDASLATAANLSTVSSNVDAILVDTGTDIPASISALNDISVTDILTTQMSESYAADGVAPTLTQALMLIQQMLGDFSISGTTLTVNRINGVTSAGTFTLNDDTSPTSITRAS